MSKMRYETRGSDQNYQNVLTVNGKAAPSGVTYKITAPANAAAKNIAIDANGKLTFKGTLVTAKVEAAYQGSTASYTFTVTGHFSKRSGHSSVVVGSDIYVIGGGSPLRNAYDNEVWKSADGGNTWGQVATQKFPARIYHSSAVISKGTHKGIYVIGGFSTTGRLNDVWKSKDGGVTWNKVNTGTRGAGTLFPIRNGHESLAVGSDIYVIGGYNGTRALNDVWKSSNGGATWAQVATGSTTASPPTLFSARQGHSLVAVSSDMYVIGGFDRTNFLNDVWKSTNGGVTWTQVAAGATATASGRFPIRSSHVSAVVGSEIYVMGGQNSANLFGDVWKSTNGGQKWRPVSTTAPKRIGSSFVAVGSALYIIGGFNGSPFNDVWKSTDKGVTWKNVHAAP